MFRFRSSFKHVQSTLLQRSSSYMAAPSVFALRTPATAMRTFRYQSSAAQTMPAEEPAATESPAQQDSLSSALKPREVVDQLNKFIVGQADAKKAVAIALRNRWRRHQLSDSMRNEVIPKNILMIGPTGCGKTEIARRIAKLSQAPFIKVEATKFTEVGFHGKDVDQIIRDLVDVSINMTKKRLKEQIKASIASVVEERIVQAVAGPSADESQLRTFREMIAAGLMEQTEIVIDVPPQSNSNNGGGGKGGGGLGGSGSDMRLDFTNASEVFKALNKVVSSNNNSNKGSSHHSNSGNSSSSSSGGTNHMGLHSGQRRMTVSEARTVLEEIEIDRQLEQYDIVKEAITSVEESGIVFIDEIDKLISGDDYRGADASSEGVQRDLLPLIEGSTISTKHGNVNTDFILFIASGAFHAAKPSDLLAELQGRLPIRVTLQGLSEEDLYRILTEPVTNLIVQQIEMLRSEQVELQFTDEAIREIARVAHATNRSVENIGARRLHTVIERVVEDISFEAPDRRGETIVVDAAYVTKKVSALLTATDLRKYIL